MKEFDLQAARCGAKVCKRNGLPVRILCFDCKFAEWPIVVETTDENGETGTLSYRLHGRESLDYITDEDLMMADDDYLEKLERGGSGSPVPAPFPDPWDEFKREAALEMVRRGHASSSDGVLFIIKMVNRLVEELKK